MLQIIISNKPEKMENAFPIFFNDTNNLYDFSLCSEKKINNRISIKNQTFTQKTYILSVIR